MLSLNLELGTEPSSLLRRLKSTLENCKSLTRHLHFVSFCFQIILLINVKVEKERDQKGESFAFYSISIAKYEIFHCIWGELGGWGSVAITYAEHFLKLV